jgi:hypothetical protein
MLHHQGTKRQIWNINVGEIETSGLELATLMEKHIVSKKLDHLDTTKMV